MKILAVADFYRHGSSRVVEDRAAALARRGHAVTLLAGVDPAEAETEEGAVRALGIEPCLIPWDPQDRGPWPLIKLARMFRAAFASMGGRGRFDAFLFNQPLSAWGVLGNTSSQGIPALHTFHSPWPLEWAIGRNLPVSNGRLLQAGIGARLQFEARRWIEGKVLARCIRVTLLSNYMRSQLACVHPRVSPQKVTLIPGGVDLERFRPLDPGAREARKEALGIPPDALLLLTVRRLVPRMGLENLLRAFRILQDEFPGIRLAVGGAGPLEASLRSLGESLGVAEGLRFLGFVPDGALPGLYSAADLFILPTAQLEGFGLVTVESLASGTLVVGTPVGATPDILRGIDPRLIGEDASPRGLAAAASLFLRLEPGSRRAIAARARRRIAALNDAEKVGDALEDLLLSISKRPRPVRFFLPKRRREKALSIR